LLVDDQEINLAALVNLRMRASDAASVTKALLEAAPKSKIVGFNGPDDRAAILAMLRAGACGYLHSACSSSEMSRALAPDSIAGRTFEVTITSGTPPVFASQGSYRFLPSGIDQSYVVI